MHALIIDDSRTMRSILRRIVTELGFDTTEAANGQEAIDAVAKLTPDVVLMDLRMPVLNGVAATRQISEFAPNSRVIVLTTFDDDEYVFDGLRAGAVGYLLNRPNKPPFFFCVAVIRVCSSSLRLRRFVRSAMLRVRRDLGANFVSGIPLLRDPTIVA